MKITNVKYYNDLPFEDYLKMPGTSFSSMKGEIPQSAGMALGSRVHQYLNEPEKYDWQQAQIVRPIAAALRGIVGEAFKYLQREVAFTADFIHNGMKLQYKGRADMLRTNTIVIDFKVLSGSLESACNRFGYPDQLSGYALPNGCPIALIIAYNKITKKTETKLIKPNPTFWEYQIVSRGTPA
jgi:hypothetical protein